MATRKEPARQAPISYSVKFVCGVQKAGTKCAPVRPGGYATDINIYNHGTKVAEIRKNFIVFVRNNEVLGREPKVARISAEDKIKLHPGEGTMDDCCRIGEILQVPPTGLTIGFLEIVSPVELTVTAVYTMTDAANRSVSIDVESVFGRAKI